MLAAVAVACAVRLLLLAPFGHTPYELLPPGHGGYGVQSEVNQVDCRHQSRLCCWSLGLKNPSGYRCFGVSLHTATDMGFRFDRDQGVLMCMSSATGVQQRKPSVLHVIVDAVSGVEGASHSSSSLASVPRCDVGEKPSVKSICLTPRSGPCSCGERDWAQTGHGGGGG